MTFPTLAVNEAFKLLPTKMDTRMARIIHAAIGYQETKYLTRVQYGNGPARGYWQFEKGGGVRGVMNFGGETEDLARKACAACGVLWDRQAVWEALAKDDMLAAVFARLLMWTDSQPLPNNAEGAWEMYALRTWLPGKPHKSTWPDAWAFGLQQA